MMLEASRKASAIVIYLEKNFCNKALHGHDFHTHVTPQHKSIRLSWIPFNSTHRVSLVKNPLLAAGVVFQPRGTHRQTTAQNHKTKSLALRNDTLFS